MTTFYQFSHTYDSRFHYHCLKNCLRQLLEFYNIPNAYLYIDIASTFSFTVLKDFQQCILFNDTATLETVEAIQKCIKKQSFTDTGVAEQYISQRLKNGAPVIVTVDTFYLPYQVSYRKNHGSHAVIICGESESKYQIVDWYEPHFYKGMIDKNDLILACTSAYSSNENPFSEISADFFTWTIDSESIPCEIKEENVFFNTLERVYGNFYKNRNSFLNPNKYFGMLAMKKWIEYIEYKLCQETEKIFFKNIHNEIFLFYISKRIMHHYISEYFKREEVEILRKIEKLISKYENVLYVIMKNSLRVNESNNSKIIEIMREIYLYESEVGEEIGKI